MKVNVLGHLLELDLRDGNTLVLGDRSALLEDPLHYLLVALFDLVATHV